MIKGDCIRVYFQEDFFNYLKSVFEWEKDRYEAFQKTVNVELNPLFIDDHTGSLWGSLYRKYNIDFTRDIYQEEFSERSIDFLVFDIIGNKILKTPLGGIFAPKTKDYLSGYPLYLEDINKKFHILSCNF